MQTVSQLPIWQSVLLLVCLPIFVAALMPIHLRRSSAIQTVLRANSDVSGAFLGAVAVVYAVVLGFVVIVTWQKFSDVQDNVSKEAGAVVTLVRLSHGLPEQPRRLLQRSIATYVRAVVSDDWPAMAAGVEGVEANSALNMLYDCIVSSNDSTENSMRPELLRAANEVTEARRARLSRAQGSVASVLWIELFVGAFICVASSWLLATTNVYLHALLSGLFTMLISVALLAVLTIDRPFVGTSSVSPQPLIRLIDDFPELQ